MIQTVQSSGSVLKVTLADGTIQWVPVNPQNIDYMNVQRWVAAGGTIG